MGIFATTWAKPSLTKAWTRGMSVSDALSILAAAQVPAGRIYTAKDIFEDPQYRARHMIERITTRDGYEVDVPGIVPKLSATPGTIRSPAPRLGEHTAELLAQQGLGGAEIDALIAKKII